VRFLRGGLAPEPSRRFAVVTGSSGEIGSRLVAHLVSAGWTVAAVDVRPFTAAAPANVVAATCDLANSGDAERTLVELARAHGTPELLVNCAGRIANAPLVRRGARGWETHDPALWKDVIDSCLTTAFNATATCARLMIEGRRRGVVVNISSVCARGNAGQVAYSAAKAGLNGLTLALAKELAPLGIRVVGLAPGYFDTKSTADNVSAERLAKITNAIPLRRLGQIDEIARAIDFIVDDQYVNGTILELDGGLVV
jgi:3-oxoacyl-[acyl-carrier protein] reductase